MWTLLYVITVHIITSVAPQNLSAKQGGFFFPGQVNLNTFKPNTKVPVGNRLSVIKCKEYTEATSRVVIFTSLSLQSVPNKVRIKQCDISQGLIVGGENAKLGEFPHMAAIGYEDFNNQVHFSCGGSLISERYVLTAAHCKKASGFKASVIRLGDLNLKVKENLMTERNIPVERFIQHHEYDARGTKHDIALIRMAEEVSFSKYIKPACLMTSDTIPMKKAIATGWGLRKALSYETSDILQKVELNIIDSNQCNKMFNYPEFYNVGDTQICAGDSESEKDTCEGDSGGPLQQIVDKDKCLYTIIGVTSYGNKICGVEPAIYTKVSAYLDWIEKHVWG